MIFQGLQSTKEVLSIFYAKHSTIYIHDYMLNPSSFKKKWDLLCAHWNKETSVTEDSLLILLHNIPTLVFYVQIVQMSHRWPAKLCCKGESSPHELLHLVLVQLYLWQPEPLDLNELNDVQNLGNQSELT